MLLPFLILCLLLAAFVLLLLVTLSVPIVKSIYLFRLVAQESASVVSASVSGTADFGVLGYCISAVQASVLGITAQTAPECSKAKLGYTFDSTVVDALDAGSIANTLSRTSTLALVLHPIACGFAFVAYAFALYAYVQRRHVARIPVKARTRVVPILLCASTVLAALFSLIAFAIDAGVVGTLRNKVYDDSDGLLTLSWGNAVWLTLAAALAIVTSLLCQWRSFGCCGRRYVVD